MRDETGLIDASDGQQTVTIGGGNQAVEVRVILYDGSGGRAGPADGSISLTFDGQFESLTELSPSIVVAGY